MIGAATTLLGVAEALLVRPPPTLSCTSVGATLVKLGGPGSG